MINRIIFTGISLFCTILLHAQDYKATLIGYNQSFPVITEAIGAISAEYDGQFLRIEGRVDDLEGVFEIGFNDGISLYRGSQGTKGIKVAQMLPFVDEDKYGFDLVDVANRFELTPVEVTALFNNELYINVGTNLHPSGEIRAQLVPAEAEVYYCTLFGSGVTHPFPTRGQGSVLITKLDDSLSISGSFRNLEGDFNISDLGAATLRSEYAGTDGALLSNLVVESDTVSNAGIIRNALNKYRLNETQTFNLVDGGIYVEIESNKFNRPELRGQATLAVKQMYIANLRSYNTIPFNNSSATGKILVQRNHGDSLYLSGSFQGLESDIALEFSGGTIMYEGLQGQIGSIQQLLVPSLSVGNRFGAFHSDNNFFEYLPDDLELLDNHGFHIIIHSEGRFNGEIRGQLMPIGQNNFSIVMNDIQTEEGIISGHKGYIDAVHLDDQISFSGSMLDTISDVSSDALSLRSGLPGKSGSQLLQLVLDQNETNSYTVAYPLANTFTVDDSLLQDLFDRKTYMDITNTIGEQVIRGQTLPTLQSIYYAPLSDRQTLLHQNSSATGMMIVEQHNDNEIRVVGTFENLESDIDDAITGNILLNEGKYGDTGAAFRALIANIDPNERGGEILADENVIMVQSSIIDSLQVSGLYLNIITEDQPDGELRGQILELADAYYNTSLDATNVVTSSLANGKGQLLFLRKGQRLITSGSFDELDGVVNISNNGGVSLREAPIDENGDIKFLLFPEYASDSLSGIFNRLQNTLFLSDQNTRSLDSENYYVELRKTSQDGPALRGQIQGMKNISPSAAVILDPLDGDTILIDGLVTSKLDFDIQSDVNQSTSLRISDQADFVPTIFARNFGFEEDVSLSYTEIDELLLSLSQQVGDTIKLYYKVVESDGADHNDGEVKSIYFVRGLVTGVPDIFRAHLTANHSVPPRQSTGYGEIVAEVLDSTLRVSGNIEGLMGEIDTMHIHIGMAGINGPAILPISATISADGKLAQLTSFENTYKLTATQLDTLYDRGLYINVHTSLFPNGEIRGQLLPDADAYYYANLLGSNLTSPYLTEAAGALSIELREGSMTISGTYNNLDSPYDFDIQGGAHLQLGLPGEEGLTLFTLVPVPSDTLNGTFQAQSNTFNFTATDLTILEGRNMYADIHTDNRPDGAIRGMVTPILKGSFRANMGSLHHDDILNDEAKGTIQIDLDVENNIGVYGTFDNLPSSTNDFNGLIQYRYGFGDDVRDLFLINANFDSQDSTSGSFLLQNNTLIADDNIVNELMLRAHHINVDLNQGFGGIRGQVLGLSQQYSFAKMNGYQMVPSQGGGNIRTVYIERVDDALQFSGRLENELSTISIRQEVLGENGNEITSFIGEDYNGEYILNPYSSTIAVDGPLSSLLDDQQIYLQHDDNSNGLSQRGQVVSNARFLHLGLVSGIGPLPSINTEAEGRVMLLSDWDGSYSFSGSVKNLGGGLNTAIAGGMHLHLGLPGDTGDIDTIISSVENASDYRINKNVINGTVQFDSLQNANALYFNVHTLDYPNGEIRSQLRPLSNYHYSATLNGTHVIDDVNSTSRGKLLLDIAGSRSTYYGSYRELPFPINGAMTASAIGYNLVYEDFNPVNNLSITESNNSTGEWYAKDNMQLVSQNTLDALDNKLAHIAINDVFDNVTLRGRLLEEINKFPNANGLSATIPNDTLLIEGTLTDSYTSIWDSAMDDEALMYKYQLSSSPMFTDLIYESNALNQPTISISYVQLQSGLSNLGFVPGDTLDLYQRIYITDGSEDIFSDVSAFTAINGIVEEPVELYRVYLSGYQQTSPVASRGQGTINITIQGNVMIVDGFFENMESSLADQLNGGAHIQIGLAGEEGPIMYSLNVDTGIDDNSGFIKEEDNIFEITNEELILIKNREAYINIYSDRYSTGELRGQILPIAEEYFLSSLTTSQMINPEYTLDNGSLVFETYSDSINITGCIHHNTNEEVSYALYVGLAGQEGAKILDLNVDIDSGGDIAKLVNGNNRIENTPGLLTLIRNREVYVATSNSENTIHLRGQILPEIKSAFYASLSGLKTVAISNSLSQGRMVMELSKNNELSFTGNVSNLEGEFTDMVLHLGLPGLEGDIIANLSAIQSMDLENYSLIAQNNTLSTTNEILEAVMRRELYLQVNSDNLTNGEVRGQFLSLAPIYAESIITGSQISNNASVRAYGMVEMEIHPQEMNAIGSVSGLPMEIDDIEYINASAALDGDIIGSLMWQNPNDGVAIISIEDNLRLYDEGFVNDIINNRISISVFSPNQPFGVARGILMPPAQGLFIAPLSGASFIDKTITPAAGIAMLVLRNETDIKFVGGIDDIPTTSLRFRLGKGYPGIIDDNPFNYLGFQQNGTGGVIYNNNNINTFTDQIISDVRIGLHHIMISTASNNSFTDYVRGQVMPIGHQAYQGTFTNYHPQGSTASNGLGKVKATLNGNTLSVVGSIDLQGAEVTEAWLGLGGVNEESSFISPVAVVDEEIQWQTLDMLNEDNVLALTNKQIHITIATDEYPNGAVRAQLLPEINYYPTEISIDEPIDGANLTIGGDSTQILDIEWFEIESPDPLKYIWELSSNDLFTDVILRVDREDNDFISFTFEELSLLLKENLSLEVGDVVTLYHRVVTSDGSEDIFGEVSDITLTLDTFVNVNDFSIIGLETVKLTPNITYGANTTLLIKSKDRKELLIEILNMDGKNMYQNEISVFSGTQLIDIRSTHLTPGKYQVLIRDLDGNVIVLDWMVL